MARPERCDRPPGSCGGLCCTKVEHYGVTAGRKVILQDINLHIHCGELTALIGPNGAGKSTLLKAILGQVKHTGRLTYMDEKGRRTGKPLIGYVPQSIHIDTGSPISVLDLFLCMNSTFPAFLGVQKVKLLRAQESLATVNAAHLLKCRLGDLSGGEMQRVLLALALDPVPDLLLLDEPVSGVDKNGIELFYDMVSDLRRKYDLSVILVSHDWDLVDKYADRAVLLDKTIIQEGPPEEVFAGEGFRTLFPVPGRRGDAS
jgi:zinc transport system ATP-binding protein